MKRAGKSTDMMIGNFISASGPHLNIVGKIVSVIPNLDEMQIEWMSVPVNKNLKRKSQMSRVTHIRKQIDDGLILSLGPNFVDENKLNEPEPAEPLDPWIAPEGYEGIV